MNNDLQERVNRLFRPGIPDDDSTEPCPQCGEPVNIFGHHWEATEVTGPAGRQSHTHYLFCSRICLALWAHG